MTKNDDEIAEAGQPLPDSGTPIVPPAPLDPFREWMTLAERGDAWVTQAPPRREWLLERDETDDERAARSHPQDARDRIGVLPLGKVGMLAAAGGVGKTMALVQLALAVASGRRWLDQLYTRQGRVLLALGEEDVEEVRRRVWNAAGVMGLRDDALRAACENVVAVPLAGEQIALVSGEGGNVAESPTLAALRRRLEGHEWRLLILDPLSRWAGADTEKDNYAATRLVSTLETLALRTTGQPTVLVAHHTAKVARRDDAGGDVTAARGVTGLVDGVRWVANIENAEAGRARMTIPTKSNYSMTGHTLELVRDRAHGGALRPLNAAEQAEKAKNARATAAAKGRPAIRKASDSRDLE